MPGRTAEQLAKRAGLATLTLVVGEGTATRVGATGGGTWTAADWLADIVPRAAFGATTALVLDALR